MTEVDKATMRQTGFALNNQVAGVVSTDVDAYNLLILILLRAITVAP